MNYRQNYYCKLYSRGICYRCIPPHYRNNPFLYSSCKNYLPRRACPHVHRPPVYPPGTFTVHCTLYTVHCTLYSNKYDSVLSAASSVVSNRLPMAVRPPPTYGRSQHNHTTPKPSVARCYSTVRATAVECGTVEPFPIILVQRVCIAQYPTTLTLAPSGHTHTHTHTQAPGSQPACVDRGDKKRGCSCFGTTVFAVPRRSSVLRTLQLLSSIRTPKAAAAAVEPQAISTNQRRRSIHPSESLGSLETFGWRIAILLD